MSASDIVAIIVKSTIILGLAGLAVRRLKPASASVRHLVWLTGLLFALGLPIATPLVAPRLVPILPSFSKRESDFAPVPTSAPWEAKPASMNHARPVPTPADGPNPLILLWAAGVLFVFGRYAVGTIRLRKLLRTGVRPVPPGIQSEAEILGMSPRWQVWQSTGDEPGSALTWGLVRPIVLLPRDADQWTAERRVMVLRHEIAHVRRYDFASQLLAELTCALYWFNPIVWLSARAMRAEAELAADDAVLAAGVKASSYASELLQLAASLGNRRPTLARVGIPIMTQPTIENRLNSVLSPSARRRGMTKPQLLVAALAVALAVPVIAGLRATTFDPTSTGKRNEAEVKEAMQRMKYACLATIMYSQDYDDRMPIAGSTESVASILKPYVKDVKDFQSPTKGGQFLYNPALSGIDVKTVVSPAETVAWHEKLLDTKAPYVNGFIDGHVKVFNRSGSASGSEPTAPATGFASGGLGTPPPTAAKPGR